MLAANFKNPLPPEAMNAKGTQYRRQVRRAAAGLNQSPEPVGACGFAQGSRVRQVTIRRWLAFFVRPHSHHKYYETHTYTIGDLARVT